MANLNLVGYDTTTGFLRQLWANDDIVDTAEQAIFLAFRGALARQSSSDTIANNTADEQINFQSEDFDVGNFFDGGSPDRLTISETGVYKVIASVGFSANTVGTRSISLIHYNSSDVEQRRTQSDGLAADTGTTTKQIEGIFQFTSTDYIRVVAFQNSGTSRTSVTNDTWVFIQRIN